jgi:serine/threonine-protein kinase
MLLPTWVPCSGRASYLGSFSMAAAADRHLLFGLLALQNAIINQGQLLAAFQAWTLDKSKSLADHLQARGDLTGAKRSLLEALAEVHLESHGGDVEKSLAAIAAGKSTHESLARIGGPDVEAAFARVGSGLSDSSADHDRTMTLSVGTMTSDGQRFRVLRPHARGGLGTVFVALDNELHREVALKQILDRHADDPVSRQRFLIEAEITGGLEHPGIVPVYGLGNYGDGRPYYAMRFIRGDSLKDAIAAFHADPALAREPGQRSLVLRMLLRRFVDICNAINYAHTRGILHRDIKPSNVIVGKHGETLVVDWGLAKAVGRREPTSSEERTLMPGLASGSAETLPGSAMGTPAYMSPEQARGEIDRLGPRSDVYSLGATLYCLLTGKPPFESVDPAIVLADVQKGEFPRPRDLERSLDPALEAICLKAMATDPLSRYATPRALADDIDCWAADEPVSAWREPIGTRSRRWARRNRTTVTAAAVAVLALFLGTGVVLAVQTRANGELREANSALAAAKDREAARFALAMGAIRLFHGEVGGDLVLKEDRFKLLRDRLLRSAAMYYGELESMLREQTDRASRAALARAYAELGELTSKLGNKPEALNAQSKALTVWRSLVKENPDDEVSQLELARSLVASADVLGEIARPEEGLTFAAEARDILERTSFSQGRVRDARTLLGSAFMKSGQLLRARGEIASAMEALTRSTEILGELVRAYPELAESRFLLASVQRNRARLMERARPNESLSVLLEARDILTKLTGDNPTEPLYRFELALSYNDIASAFDELGQPREALESYRQALALVETLVGDYPEVSSFRWKLAAIHYNLSRVYSGTGQLREALASYRSTVAVEQKLVDDHPAMTEYRNWLAYTHNNIGWLLWALGEPASALESHRTAESIAKKLVEQGSGVTTYLNTLAHIRTSAGDDMLALGRPAEAEAVYLEAVKDRREIAERDPRAPSPRGDLAISVRRLGLSRFALGKVAAAIADWREAAALLEGLPNLAGVDWYELACCHASLSGAAGLAGSDMQPAEREIEAELAMNQLRKSFEMGYRDPGYLIEAGLDPLRSRPAFQLLLMDIAMPIDPFLGGE